uniref:Uncharacterized protein n=1 Tax=Globisporangium ultimum (strain ATCC 200006 / CBS 805.95 / DAOM BR144) TaxID=431595 RepID=K3WJP0_GLOUD
MPTSSRASAPRAQSLPRLGPAALCIVALAFIQWGTVSAALITAFSWTNNTVQASTDLRFEINVEATPVSADAVFTFRLNELFGIPSSASIDTTLLAPSMDGTFGVELDDNTILLTRNNDGSEVPVETSLLFVLSGLKNPPFAGIFNVGLLIVSNSTLSTVLSTSLSAMEVKPGMIWNSHLEFASMISGRPTTLQLQIMPANVFPGGGAIVVSLPYIYGSSSSASIGQIQGFDGQVELSTSNRRMEIRRREETGTSTIAMQMINIRIDDILHPLLEGPIGNHIRVEMLDGHSRIIDQIYIDTSNLILEKAQVFVSSRYLQVLEGFATTYALTLSAPPENEFLTILPSLSPSDAEIHVHISPDRVLFSASNWSALCTVTVTVPEDEIASGGPGIENVVFITHTIADAPSEQSFASIDLLRVRVEEDDIPLIKLSSQFAAVVEGLKNGTYEIVLMSQPTGVVRVDPKPIDSFISTVPQYVVFTPSNWEIPQQVTIVGSMSTAEEILSLETSRKTSVIHSASSSDPNFNSTSGLFVPQNQNPVDLAGFPSAMYQAGLHGVFRVQLVSTAQEIAQIPLRAQKGRFPTLQPQIVHCFVKNVHSGPTPIKMEWCHAFLVQVELFVCILIVCSSHVQLVQDLVKMK